MTGRLIGLYSPAPRSGKTTVANYLYGHGFRIVPFAESLKRMAQVFLRELGLTEKEVEFHLRENKEALIPVPKLQVSARHVCQTLGTEWGRTCVHPDVWLTCWARKASLNLERGIDVVVDDVRFPNEADLIRSMGGALWRVERPLAVRNTSHSSEGGLDDVIFDRRIVNDCSLVELYSQVKSAVTVLNSQVAS